MIADESETLSKQEWNECMAKIKSRDKHAYAMLFHYYSPRLKQFAFRYISNEQVAIEIVQEAMAAVWQKAHLFDAHKSAVSTWIYTITRNLCFDMLRKQKGKELHVRADDIWPTDYCPPDFVDHYSPETDRLKEQIIHFLDNLPKPQRDVVRAVYLQDLPHQEVADMYDIPLGTVKSRLRLAVEKLRLSMEEH
ncbi:sigma-70 family RNA polymerase sigma factor [Vibrio sp. ZSDZ65]|uniref:Sigma-70 family RNA polymerase sigma factor n=1 Tax=Vibrio qingdaonensis TaxID=2829491 RepID=A0A9X3CPP1_9VIBR|nr:sigma-70 family RNA polymerase sigma factor [Vibrio qingdaonensis]MCW8347298.1 sigma-70 family RNA polymerase sigma factor [Vibrio qingdaonensis]